MKPIESKISKIFFWLVAASFLTPLVYSGAFYVPFISTKTFFFYFVTELTLPFYLYLCFRFFGFRHLKNPIIYLSAGFLGVSFISTITGLNFIHSFWGDFDRMQGVYLGLHMFLWLVYLTLLIKIDRTKIDFLFNLLIGIAAATAVHGILQLFGIGPIQSSWPGRSVSVFGNPIFFAAFLVIPLFLCLYQFDRFKKNYWYLGLAAIILAGILTTKTAGAEVGMAAGFAIAIVAYVFDQKKIKTTLITVFILAVLTAISIWAIGKYPQLKYKFEGDDAQTRLIEWGMALRGFTIKPILGVGPENYSYISNKDIDDRIYNYDDGFFDKPHNYFLEVLDTRGLVGLIVYLAEIGFVVTGLWKLYQTNKLTQFGFAALLGGLTAYLVQNFFAFDLIAALMTLTLLYALTTMAWDAGENRANYKIYYANWSFALAAILFLYLSGINLKTAKASVNLTDALKFSQSNPALAENYFIRLTSMPFYADAPTIGTQYEGYVTNLTETHNNNQVTLDLIKKGITSAISDNQKIVDQNPNYFENLVSLARLYLLKSEIDQQIDPKVYEICDEANKLAPNRIEGDLVLIDAYNFAGNFNQAQVVMADLNKKAPNTPDVIWEQVFVDAISGKAELVLSRVKEIITQSTDQTTVTQVDKLGTFYLNEAYYSQAEALYSEVLQIQPQYTYFYVQLARVYAASGDKKTAQQVVDTLKQKDQGTYEQYKDQINDFLK